ncbi:MAG TPA: DsrE family protein [Methanoculleus sp.]|mgnify:CR=1 FL=1|nr:DsrE family protein [Methanoculleus sp.]
MTPLKIVVHLDEHEMTALALRSTKNLVAHAGGVENLRTGGPNADLMGMLAGHGVRFVVCENALRSLDLPEKDFPGYVGTVLSGIVERVISQAEGWCHLRS